MPGLLAECEACYGKRSLYAVLGLQPDASQNEIKRSYHRMSLKVHPDRVGDDKQAEATKKFQILSKVYTILSDKDKKAVYDECGEIADEDEASLSEDKDWAAYWRMLFPQVTLQDIVDFEKTYKGSDEELQDLKNAYLKHGGDLNLIMTDVFLAQYTDEERFTKILRECIEKDELPEFDAFTKETKQRKQRRLKKAQKEAKEAEEMKNELESKENASLTAMIRARGAQRDQQFLADLEAKYAPKPKKNKAKGTKK